MGDAGKPAVRVPAGRASHAEKRKGGASSLAGRETDARVTVKNVNVPGYTARVDRFKYEAVKKAIMKVLPKKAPGLTQAEMLTAVLPHLDEELFPGGAKAGWWTKTVQLDLEARGKVKREKTKPLRWHRA